jgi:hypothetical protein
MLNDAGHRIFGGPQRAGGDMQRQEDGQQGNARCAEPNEPCKTAIKKPML